MIITPAQPQNSAINIFPKIPTNPGLNQSRKSIQYLKKKTPTTKKLKQKRRKNDDNTETVPKKAVLLEIQMQEAIRKNADLKLKSSEDHKDVLMQRKQILADILKEYEYITKDKIVLTAEIQNMKKYLLEIRSKLDQSLKVLSKNTALFAMKKGVNKYVLDRTINNTKRMKKQKKVVPQPEPTLNSILHN